MTKKPEDLTLEENQRTTVFVSKAVLPKDEGKSRIHGKKKGNQEKT